MLYAGTPKSAHNKYSKVANIPVVETKAMTNLAFGAEFPVAWGRDGLEGDSVVISSLGKGGLVGTGEPVIVPSSGPVTMFVGDKVPVVPGVRVILDTVGVGEAVAVPSSGRVTSTFVGEKVTKTGTVGVERSDATAGWDEDSSDDGVLETSDGLGVGDEVSSFDRFPTSVAVVLLVEDMFAVVSIGLAPNEFDQKSASRCCASSSGLVGSASGTSGEPRRPSNSISPCPLS